MNGLPQSAADAAGGAGTSATARLRDASPRPRPTSPGRSWMSARPVPCAIPPAPPVIPREWFTATARHSACVATTQADTIGISGRDTVMPIVPMFHVNAWGLPHAAGLVGAKVVFPGKFMDPARVAQVMADEKVTLSGGVPTIWLGLLQVLKQRPDLDLSATSPAWSAAALRPREALIEGLDALWTQAASCLGHDRNLTDRHGGQYQGWVWRNLTPPRRWGLA